MSKVRAKVGLLTAGHRYYWKQYPGLKERSTAMAESFREMIGEWGDVVAPEMVDSEETSRQAGHVFRQEKVDMVFVFPVGYTPAMNMLPALMHLDVPLRIVNAHSDATYDYPTADTAEYLFHEGVCCVPELAGTLTHLNKPFRVRTGTFSDPRLRSELRADVEGSAAATFFKRMNVGLIGQVYPQMGDMPIDEHRLMRATGKMLVRPEVEEIENAYNRVSEDELEDMYCHFRKVYQVDETVSNDDLRFSAQTAVAFDEIIHKYDIFAYGFYWWGERELVTQLRAQSGLAVSRLTAMGRPGVTEGDVKSAMAMKILDLLDGGGMFVEFFSMDFKDEFLLMGHDGPSNVNMAVSRPRLKHLDTHHGKSGHGLGIDFEVQQGTVTLLNLTQFAAGDSFKLIYTIAEFVPGSTLRIGNPNCRVKVNRPIHEFMDLWCRQGPSHHIAMGTGDHSAALETFAEAMQFPIVRV